MSDQDVMQTGSRQPGPRGRTTIPDPASPARILIVDRDAAGRALLSILLGIRFSVNAASRVVDGFHLVREWRPDAVVVDLESVGVDALCFLATTPKLAPATRTVALGTKELGHEVLRARVRVSAFLAKPMDANDLMDRVNEVTFDHARPDPMRHRLSRITVRALEHLAGHYAGSMTVEAIGRAIGTSPSRLAHRFRAETGITVKEALRRFRVELAKALLVDTEDKLERIAVIAGFCDSAHLSRTFRGQTGRSPGAYRLDPYAELRSGRRVPRRASSWIEERGMPGDLTHPIVPTRRGRMKTG